MTIRTKRVLCPERLRHVPHQFSWIDQRLVREGHIARCGPAALALYLLLVTVADAQGLSYYSDKTAARLLSLSETELREARRALLAAGLIAYESPLYQVLSLEPAWVSEQAVPRTGQTLPMSAILRQILEAGGAEPTFSSRSSASVTNAAPLSLPPTKPSNNGLPSSTAIVPLLLPSSIVCSITPKPS